MWRGLALLLLGYLVATATCDSSSSSSSEEDDDDDGPGPFMVQRVDDSAFRLERIEGKLKALKNFLDERKAGGHVCHVLSVETFLEQYEGTSCDSVREFSCRKGKGMCIASYLTCDGTNDCPNGEDEDEHMCENHATPGSTFTGLLHWDGCKVFPDGEMTISITGNTVHDYFPSRVWLTTRTTVSSNDGPHTFESHGYLDYGNKRIDLDSMHHVDHDCRFIGADYNVLDCTITSHLTHCAKVRLVRQ